MDFFEAQERARQRSKRLILLFALAVIGTIAAGYASAIIALDQQQRYAGYDTGYYAYDSRSFTQRWWDPRVFAMTTGGTLAVVGFASLFKWSQMRRGGPAVAEMVGGRRVDLQTTEFRERQLLNVVEEMAIASGIPVPAVYILDNEPGLNAFAAGLNTSDAAVAVTRGTLEKLNRDELQGVVAHEFSHILNGDMRLNVRITAIVFGILVIGILGRSLLYSVSRGRMIRGGGDKNKGGGAAAIIGIGLALMIIGYIGYFFGRLIQAAVSRQREFLADASAVQFTRNPNGISGALKKIGGYALGGTIANSHAAELGHFFFSQSFKSNFGGLWATHPPLDQRIRAVEPNWDGKLFTPETKVDIKTESFRTAGHTPRPRAGAIPGIPPILPPVAFAPAVVVANIGTLTDSHFSEAQSILNTIPDQLRDATHDTTLAPALVFALVIGASANDAPQANELIVRHAGQDTLNRLATLQPLLAPLAPAARLPLLQLCLPTLRQLDAAALDQFATTLDELIHADAQVTTFEFALHKMVLHHLEKPNSPSNTVEYHSFHAVADAISLVLSLLARTGQRDEVATETAFKAGAVQLPLIADRVQLLPATACGLDAFSDALDRLARGSIPIKKRLLVAAAYTISADGTVTVDEGDLYRAVAASIDCPVPMLAGIQ
jgi:Zn-dependent protease with chaperone function